MYVISSGTKVHPAEVLYPSEVDASARSCQAISNPLVLEGSDSELNPKPQNYPRLRVLKSSAPPHSPRPLVRNGFFRRAAARTLAGVFRVAAHKSMAPDGRQDAWIQNSETFRASSNEEPQCYFSFFGIPTSAGCTVRLPARQPHQHQLRAPGGQRCSDDLDSEALRDPVDEDPTNHNLWNPPPQNPDVGSFCYTLTGVLTWRLKIGS